MNVAILTGGGDCPGLNAVIRAVVRKGLRDYGWQLTGLRNGWRGLLEKDVFPLDLEAVERHPSARGHHFGHLPHQSLHRGRRSGTG